MAWKPDYVTVDEMAEFTSIPDDVDDVQIAVAITAASRAIDDHCNRQFGKVDSAEQRFYKAWFNPDRYRWFITVDDLQVDPDEVTINGTAITDYRLEPRNAATTARPWTRLVLDSSPAVVPSYPDYEAAVTAVWGWTAVPTAVRQATFLQTNRFLFRRQSPFGVAGSPDAGGSELRLLAKVDADVAVSLRGLVRPRSVY